MRVGEGGRAGSGQEEFRRGPKRHASAATWPIRFTACLCLLGLTWFAARTDHWSDSFPLTGEQNGYYSELVRSFLLGRTSFEAEPDARLESPDPHVRAQVPNWQDAAVFRGRHYLYYGVVPAVLVMVPYAVLTGNAMGESIVVLIGVGLGFFASVQWWCDLRRRYFPSLGGSLSIAVVVGLAFGPGSAALLVRSEFYEIPMAWAYAMAMLSCWCASRAWHSAHSATRWLSAAGLFAALAVGCRPEFVLSLPGLALLAWWRARCDETTWRKTLFALLRALSWPVVMVAIGLATYNTVRFGNPLDTGFNHGANEFFTSGDKLMSVRFIAANLRWYLFSPPTFSPYFPFIFPLAGSFWPEGYHGDEAMHGQGVVTLLLGCALLAAVTARSRIPWRKVAGDLLMPLLIAGTTLIFLCLLGIRANRYAIDFVGPLLLIATFVIGCAGSHLRNLSRGLLAIILALVALVNVGVAFQQFNRFPEMRPTTHRQLAAIFNVPARLLERWGLLAGGPIRFSSALPAVKALTNFPLLTTGLPYYADMVYLTLSPLGVAELLVVSQDRGEIRSEPFSYVPGKKYTFEIELGSLYPPAGGPYFAAYEPFDVARAKAGARVAVDGVERMNATMALHEAPPWTISVGRNDTVFAGRDVPRALPEPPQSVEHLASKPERRNLGASGREGVWRFKMSLPNAPRLQPVPLLASGQRGKGNLLYLVGDSADTVHFGLDFWGVGADRSPTVRLASNRDHVLEIFVGPAAPRQGALAAHVATMQVWLDGERVWSPRLTAHLDTYARVFIGANVPGFDSAGPYFPGDLRPLPMEQSDVQDLLKRVAQQAAP